MGLVLAHIQIGGCPAVEQYVGVFGEDVIGLPLVKASFGTGYWLLSWTACCTFGSFWERKEPAIPLSS